MVSRITVEAKAEAAEQIMGSLPHGSGINYKWDYTICDNGSVRYMNRYDVFEDGGYYKGSIPFTVILSKKYGDGLFKLQFGRENKHFLLTHAYGLRDYLEDTFCNCFANINVSTLMLEVAK
jgi:hypothetical protein